MNLILEPYLTQLARWPGRVATSSPNSTVYEQLTTPRELVYPVVDAAIASRLGMAIS